MDERVFLCLVALSPFFSLGNAAPHVLLPQQHLLWPKHTSPPCSPPAPCFGPRFHTFIPPFFGPHAKIFPHPRHFPQPLPYPFPRFHPSPIPQPFPRPYPFPNPNPGQWPLRPNGPGPFGPSERPFPQPGPRPDQGGVPDQGSDPQGRPDFGQNPNSGTPEPETDIQDNFFPSGQGPFPQPDQGNGPDIDPEIDQNPDYTSNEETDLDRVPQRRPFDSQANPNTNQRPYNVPDSDSSQGTDPDQNQNTDSQRRPFSPADQDTNFVQSANSNERPVSFPDQSSNSDPNDLPQWAVRIDPADEWIPPVPSTQSRIARASDEPAVVRRKRLSVLLYPPYKVVCASGEMLDSKGRCREIWGR